MKLSYPGQMCETRAGVAFGALQHPKIRNIVVEVLSAFIAPSQFIMISSLLQYYKRKKIDTRICALWSYGFFFFEERLLP
jgi:hypothetical protein